LPDDVVRAIKGYANAKPKVTQKTVKASKKKFFFPDDVARHIMGYAKTELNVYDRRPALKIMETEDVSKWIDYVFGYDSDWGQERDVVKRIEQQGEYQIIHLNNLLDTQWVDYLDDFYVDLDTFGALWIERTTEPRYKRRFKRERQPTDGGIDYYTKPHEGCWQIQYADPDTPKRIVQFPKHHEKDFKDQFPDAVKVTFTLDGRRETGYYHDRKKRPEVEMTPFLPRISNLSTNSEAEASNSEASESNSNAEASNDSE
jgi:hypothetical protein